MSTPQPPQPPQNPQNPSAPHDVAPPGYVEPGYPQQTGYYAPPPPPKESHAGPWILGAAVVLVVGAVLAVLIHNADTKDTQTVINRTPTVNTTQVTRSVTQRTTTATVTQPTTITRTQTATTPTTPTTSTTTTP